MVAATPGQRVLAAVREFFRHAAATGLADEAVLDALFEVAELRPAGRCPRRGHGPRLRRGRGTGCANPSGSSRASDEEVLALLRACRNARDRFIVLALWRIGHRRGELTGVRVEDVHFVPDATRLGCRVGASTCTSAAGRTRTGRRPSPGGRGRFPLTGSWSRPTTST